MINCSLLIQITFISYDHNESFLSSYFSYIIDPFTKIRKRVSVFLKTWLLVMSNTMIAALESLM